MEAIIESVDEFYSENLAQEVVRGMREAASRGFWVASRVPYGYRKLLVQDGAKKRPTLELDPATAPVVERIFGMAEAGRGILDITRTLNDEGIANPTGRLWSKNGVHIILKNEVYTGTLVWGTTAKEKADPVRVEKAFPAIVSKAQFKRVNRKLRSRAPKRSHPRRVGSTYLLSGLVRCRACNRALSGQDAKSGRFAYYVCQSVMKRGSGACDAPRLNARRFEEMVVGKIRENVLTESNIRELVKLVDEEMDGIAREQRQKLETIESELVDVKRRLERLYDLAEDHRPGHRGLQAPYPRPQRAAGEAGGVCGGGEDDPLPAQGGPRRRGDHHGLLSGHERVPERERADGTQGLHRELREGDRRHARQRRGALHDSDARRQPHTGERRRGDGPERLGSVYRQVWWAWMDSNQRPRSYQDRALTA